MLHNHRNQCFKTDRHLYDCSLWWSLPECELLGSVTLCLWDQRENPLGKRNQGKEITNHEDSWSHLWSSFSYKQTFIPVICNNQQQKKWQNTLCYCICIYYKKAVGESFTEYYLIQKVYSSAKEPQCIVFLLGLLRQLAFLQSSMHQAKGLRAVFSSKLHFPVNLWVFICSVKVGAPASEDVMQ